MNKTAVGAIVGGGLGLLDGMSAWVYPEARAMIVAIVVGSTIKGVLTGIGAGLIARRWQSLPAGVIGGLAIGFALSTLVAIGQPSDYWKIVLPGMLVGSIVGFVTQRYPTGASGRARATLIAIVLLPALADASAATSAVQSKPPANELSQLDVFIGRWEGTSEGQPGNSSVEREYTRLFGSRFVQVRHRSVYKPQPKNPKGETHEDFGVFSFDSARKRMILRQFHTEGFVNQYVSDPSAPPGSLTFTTEAIENIPAGWRARERYTILGENEIVEVFELAEPAKEFELYSRTRLKRVR